ncbi:MAG: hypothetical protein ABI347_12135 [Nitrososphaera sp.]|jgi:hypothetical protein
MKCAACSHDGAAGKYCRYHLQAFEQLQKHYKTWVRAYGEMSWDSYLAKVKEMKETGDWVREVIEAETKKAG